MAGNVALDGGAMKGIKEEYVYVQTQAPAGNWSEVLGTTSLKSAQEYAEYERGKGNKARVIERQYRVLSKD